MRREQCQLIVSEGWTGEIQSNQTAPFSVCVPNSTLCVIMHYLCMCPLLREIHQAQFLIPRTWKCMCYTAGRWSCVWTKALALLHWAAPQGTTHGACGCCIKLQGRPENEFWSFLPRFESWPHYLLWESCISFSLPESQLCKMEIKIPSTS